jgi:flagellar basal body-associated protein FliL
MPPQQNQNDPYEFITSPQQPGRRIGFGQTPAQRAIIVGVGVLVLIIIALVLSSLFSSASNAQKDRLIELAQTQTEIVRVAAIADKQSADIDTRASAVTARFAVETDLQETNQMLEARGTELNSKILSLKENEKTDSLLEEAFANNRFDETFNSVLEQQLEDYQSLVQAAYSSGSSGEKAILQQNYEDISLLLERLAS